MIFRTVFQFEMLIQPNTYVAPEVPYCGPLCLPRPAWHQSPTALAVESGLAVIRRPFSVAEALAAKEAFITSASTLCQSVVTIDGQTIGTGTPGPVAMRLRALYIAFARATAV